jgi:N4-(beta-N-acetylglucosaminyl)-L-asparaginase
MYNRRKFIKLTAAGASASLVTSNLLAQANFIEGQSTLPVVISTWNFGIAANQAAWKVLAQGGRALDAVEAGVKIPEADLSNHTVGRAGYPDRDGRVTLDACIMDEHGNCGAVAAMEHSPPYFGSTHGNGKNAACNAGGRWRYTVCHRTRLEERKAAY